MQKCQSLTISYISVGQVFDLAGFICIQVSPFNHLFSGEFFSTVSMICFVFTAVLFLLYVFRVVNKLEHIPWLKIEMWFCAVTVLIFLVASVLVSCERTWTFLAAAVSTQFILLRVTNNQNYFTDLWLFGNVCVWWRYFS